jgi:hypothetical protein
LIAGYNPKKQRLDSVVKLQKDKSGL